MPDARRPRVRDVPPGAAGPIPEFLCAVVRTDPAGRMGDDLGRLPHDGGGWAYSEARGEGHDHVDGLGARTVMTAGIGDAQQDAVRAGRVPRVGCRTAGGGRVVSEVP